jgi:hypothetical protein
MQALSLTTSNTGIGNLRQILSTAQEKEGKKEGFRRVIFLEMGLVLRLFAFFIEQ